MIQKRIEFKEKIVKQAQKILADFQDNHVFSIGRLAKLVGCHSYQLYNLLRGVNVSFEVASWMVLVLNDPKMRKDILIELSKKDSRFGSKYCEAINELGGLADIEMICDHLNTNYQATSQSLVNLCNRGQIERVDRGVYKTQHWDGRYPEKLKYLERRQAKTQEEDPDII